MMPVSDETLMAWLDGELDQAARSDVEAALAANAALRERLERQRRLRARLDAHYGPVAEQPVPARLSALLDPKIVDLATVRQHRQRPAWQGFAAIAATLVLGIAIGALAPFGGTAPVAVHGNALVAQGPLADALDRQLASTQAAAAPTRIWPRSRKPMCCAASPVILCTACSSVSIFFSRTYMRSTRGNVP